jgi:hypothetical protein
LLKNWQTTIIVVLIGYLLPLLNIGVGGFDVVFYSALAFGIGTFISFKWLLKLPCFLKYIVVILHLATSITFILLGVIEKAFFKEIMVLFGIYSSVLFISLLQNIKFISQFLLFINKYSLQIYLLHTIFTAGLRIILMRLNITQWWIHIILGTVGGILFSVLAAIIAQKTKILNFFFFPSKTVKMFKSKSVTKQ